MPSYRAILTTTAGELRKKTDLIRSQGLRGLGPQIPISLNELYVGPVNDFGTQVPGTDVIPLDWSLRDTLSPAETRVSIYCR